MKRGISDANKSIINNPNDNKEPVVLSLDVCALYPSINKNTAEDAILKMTVKSKIDFNVNIRELTKVIRILSSDEEFRKLKVLNYMPTRILDIIGKRQKVNITYLENDHLYFKWIWHQRFKPSRSKSRLLVSI